MGRKCSLRAKRALASHKPMSAAKNAIAMQSERVVARSVGGRQLPDNEPMDVIVRRRKTLHGIEVKTIIDGQNDKITMHKDSRERKLKWARETGGSLHTVAVKGDRVWYKPGVGSFRLGTMTEVRTFDELAEHMGL